MQYPTQQAPVPQESLPLKIGKPETLKQTLRMIMLKTGIRAANLPADEEKQVLLNFIQKYYADYSPAQIMEAFDLALVGAIEVDARHFENFSCEYFGRIMAAYQRHMIATGKFLRSFDAERMAKVEEQKQIGMPVDWLAHAKSLKGQEVDIAAIPVDCYNALELAGLIDYEAYQAYLPQARQAYSDFSIFGQKLRKNITDGMVIMHAKKLAVKQWLQS